MDIDDRAVLRKLREHVANKPSAQVMTAKDVGVYLRSVRKDIGLTQGELAYISGVGLSFIHDLEHGKDTVQFDSLMKVVNRLGCDLHISQRGSTRGR